MPWCGFDKQMLEGLENYHLVLIEIIKQKSKEKGKHTVLITKQGQKGVSFALKNRVHEHVEISEFRDNGLK